MKFDKKYFKGHELKFNEKSFKYEIKDSGIEVVKHAEDIPCKCCGKTSYNVDSCLSLNDNVIYACCGHGIPEMAYIRLKSGVCYDGEEALKYMIENKIKLDK